MKKTSFDCFAVSTAAYRAYKNADYRTSANLLLVWKSEIENLKRDQSAAYAFWLLGISLYMCEDYVACESYLLKAERIYRSLNKSETLNCIWWRAMSLQIRKHYKKSASVYKLASDCAIQFDLTNSGWPSRAQAHIGYCLWQVKEYAKACSAFSRSIDLGKDASLSSIDGLIEKLMHLYSDGAESKEHRIMLRKLIGRATKSVDAKLKKLSAPESRKDATKERLFGCVIDDPYRWLEDVYSDEVKAWISLQNYYSNEYLTAIPGRSEMLKRIHKMFSSKELKSTYKVGRYYFTSDKHPSKVYRSEKLGQFSKLVLSSDDWPKNHRLTNTVISRDGNYIAYFVNAKGSDWQSIYVKNMSTGKRIRGVIKNVRARTVVWDKESTGFYYAAFNEDDDRCRIRYHKLRSKQSDDRLIFTIEEPDVYASITMVDACKYLMVYTYGTRRTRHAMFLIGIQSARPKIVPIFDEQSYAYHYIGQKNDSVFFITDKNAPMFRIVSLSIRDVEKCAKSGRRVRFSEVINEKSYSLKRAFKWGDYLVCVYASESGEVIKRWNTAAQRYLKPIELPVGTSVTEFHYLDYPIVRMMIEGYTVPPTIYELNFETGSFSSKSDHKLMVDPTQFVTEKLHARARDGSKIPFFVRYKKGLKLDGNNPTLMTGYGGFDREVEPTCDNYDLVWMDLGGICVEALLRGDAGLGAEWRKAGTRESKQLTFDDFVAVARTLIRKKYTCPQKLGISGFSNGGLLTGVALTQHPELFGAVEIGCGLLDMLRFHKFGTERHYELEYGTATTKKFFEVLRAYSPLHNLAGKRYPPVLINTGSHDDRVSPAHSYKFAASLQKLQQSDSPVLLNVEMDAGHGFHAQSNLGVNRLSFFGYELGLIPRAFLTPTAAPPNRAEKGDATVVAKKGTAKPTRRRKT